jgi:hypothetical protein
MVHPTASSLITPRYNDASVFLISFAFMASNEPHHQHQNLAERKIGDTKRFADAIMHCTGTQASFWLLCLLYVVFLLNHLASDALGGLTPIEMATGQPPEISALLHFRLFEPVLYSVDNSSASDSPEKSGCWVGVAETLEGMLSLTLSSRMIHRRSSLVNATSQANAPK